MLELAQQVFLNVLKMHAQNACSKCMLKMHAAVLLVAARDFQEMQRQPGAAPFRHFLEQREFLSSKSSCNT
jgi:hypothetical protein